MKKIFLFVSVAAMTLSLNSCSNDDDGGGSSLTLKINGTKKTFKTQAFSFFGATTVFGYIGNVDTPTESVQFDIATGTGAGKITDFSYDNANDSYSPTTVVTSNVTTNSATAAKGTFSCTLEPDTTAGEDLVITEGTFSVKVIADNN